MKEYVDGIYIKLKQNERELIKSRMKEAEELYAASDDNHTLGTLAVYKAEGKMHEYYEQVGELTDEMKYTYRELVKDRVK